MKKPLVIILCISSLFANLDIFTSVSSDTIFVGEKIDMTISINKTYLLNIDFPKLDVDNKDVTIETIAFDDSTLILSLQFWQSGIHEFPPVKINFINEKGIQNTLYSDAISLNVLDITLGIENTLRGNKNNQKIQLPFTKYQILLICLIFILIIISYLFIRRRNKVYKSKDSFKKINFMEEALVKIDRLKLPDDMQSIELEQFYISLSNIIKKYLLQKFFFNATKMTTSEILIFLQSNNIPSNGLDSLLQEADLCKFAKQKYGSTTLLKAKEKTKTLLFNFEKMTI